MLIDLIVLANSLDKKGCFEEADKLDFIIKKIALLPTTTESRVVPLDVNPNRMLEISRETSNVDSILVSYTGMNLRQILSIVDPTGTLSVPDVPIAYDQFVKSPGFLTALFFILSIIAIAPLIGKGSKAISAGMSASLKTAKTHLMGSKILSDNVSAALVKAAEDVTSSSKPYHVPASNINFAALANAMTESAQPFKIVDPLNGELGSIGYHVTDISNIKSIQTHGLDNRIGRSVGLDAAYKTKGGFSTGRLPTVSNWTSTPKGALEFGYGNPNAVLLSFETGSKMLKSQTNLSGVKLIFSIGSEITVTPKAEYLNWWNSLENIFGVNLRENVASVVASHPERFKAISNGIDISDSLLNKSADEIRLHISDFIQNPKYEGSVGGSLDKVIPPGDISVSFDKGETFYHLLDLTIE